MTGKPKAPHFTAHAEPLPARHVQIITDGRVLWEGTPTLKNRTQWGHYGACNGDWPLVERMYADHGSTVQDAANEACPGCPAAEACLELGVTNRELRGVWGGIPAGSKPFKTLVKIRKAVAAGEPAAPASDAVQDMQDMQEAS